MVRKKSLNMPPLGRRKNIMKMQKVSFFLLLCIFMNCQKPPSKETGSLAFYFLKDSSISTVEAVKIDTDSLIINETPFLSINEIVNYAPVKHELLLDEKAIVNLRNMFSKKGCYPITISGKPIVLVSNNKKCYLWSFWSMFSSVAPPCPQILIDSISNPIRILPGFNVDTARRINDDLLITIFQKANKLQL